MRKALSVVAFTAEVLAIAALPVASVAAASVCPIAHPAISTTTTLNGDVDADITNGTLNVGSGPG